MKYALLLGIITLRAGNAQDSRDQNPAGYDFCQFGTWQSRQIGRCAARSGRARAERGEVTIADPNPAAGVEANAGRLSGPPMRAADAA
jgi:hypothetical protein